MKTSSAKAKGRRLCQKVVELFIDSFSTVKNPNNPVQRQEIRENFNVTSSGVTGPDITMSPLAYHQFPMLIECKNQEKINIWRCWEQVKGHQSRSKRSIPLIPVLIFSRNNSDILITMKLEDFLHGWKVKHEYIL